jgi:hypothetical protein
MQQIKRMQVSTIRHSNNLQQEYTDNKSQSQFPITSQIYKQNMFPLFGDKI